MESTEKDCKIKVIFHTDKGDRVFALTNTVESFKESLILLWHLLRMTIIMKSTMFKQKIAMSLEKYKLYIALRALYSRIVYKLYTNRALNKLFIRKFYKDADDSVGSRYNYSINNEIIRVEKTLNKLRFFCRYEKQDMILQNIRIEFNGVEYKLDEFITLLKLSNAVESHTSFTGITLSDVKYKIDKGLVLLETKSLQEKMLKFKELLVDEAKEEYQSGNIKKHDKTKIYEFAVDRFIISMEYAWVMEPEKTGETGEPEKTES